MKHLLICLSFLLLACTNADMEKKQASTESELAEAKLALTQLESRAPSKGQLIHLVLFKLKPDADIQFLSEELNKLTSIEEVRDLSLGEFEEVGDERSLKEYPFMMQIRFDNVEAYKTYQQDTLHLGVKKRTFHLLAGPPSSYDYLID
ncbi:MAG: Dabb family protein [Bacteroidota bacterium]